MRAILVLLAMLTALAVPLAQAEPTDPNAPDDSQGPAQEPSSESPESSGNETADPNGAPPKPGVVPGICVWSSDDPLDLIRPGAGDIRVGVPTYNLNNGKLGATGYDIFLGPSSCPLELPGR